MATIAAAEALVQFVDTFRKVRHVKVGGSPGGKASPADRITWAGVWAGQRVVLRTQPRNVHVGETFLISSNQRLRTSGHSGQHFVDVELLEGVFGDAQLAELEALMQACDPRPVRVRRKGAELRPWR